MTTISDGTTTYTPTAVDGYASARAGGSIVHPIIGAAFPDISLRPAQARTGTLRLGFTSEADSAACEAAHAAAAVFTLTSALGTIEMSYIVPEGGKIARELDETRAAWLVIVDYHEVSP